MSCDHDYSVINSPNITEIVDTSYIYIYEDETHVEVDFIQEPEQLGAIDILVVLDRSCSMTDDADRTGLGMSLLAAQMTTLTTDYQFGFITADSSCATTEYEGPYDSSSTLIDIQLAPGLLDMDCGLEEGFGASYLFISDESNILIRDSADLLVFLISDEDEQSSISTSTWKAWYDSLKDTTTSKADVVSIVITEESTCGYSPGTKYIELMTLYGKTPVDLCSEEWEVWLNQSSFLTALVYEKQLSYIPDPNTIIMIDQYETSYLEGTQWSYDQTTNIISLLFEPEYDYIYTIAYETAY